VRSQTVSIARSQAWNACIPVIEAGIEDAMGHLNNPTDTNILSDGWALSSGNYVQQRQLGDSFYSVSITLTNPLKPLIVCTGYVPIPLSSASTTVGAVAFPSAADLQSQYLSRTVQVVALKTLRFVKAMACRQQISMSGNNVSTDSFDSSDPLYSTNGHYDPTRIKDNGDVSTDSRANNIINAGNANIRGRVRTGPGGTVAIGPNGKVGSLAWNASSSSGIQPGWFSDDVNITFPPVMKPFTNAPAPNSGTYTGALCKYVLGSTNYQFAGNLTLSSGDRLVVTGNAVLFVSGNLNVSGSIDIFPPGTLKLYVAGADANIKGGGINNTGWATNFIYYGLPSNLTVTLHPNGNFTGMIYAPDATLTLLSGGAGIQDFIGACIMNNITVNGHYNFHYDEALGKWGEPALFVAISWIEL
jgi:hypothetical protein